MTETPQKAAQPTLADIVAAAEAKYAGLAVPVDEGTTVTLRPLLTVPKDARRKVNRLQKENARLQAAEEAGEDVPEGPNGEDASEQMVANLLETFRLVADSGPAVEALITAIGEQDHVVIELWERYGNATQPGEA